MNEFHYEYLPFHELEASYIIRRGAYADEKYSFPPHWHESIEILYFWEGECEVIIDTQAFKVVPGDIVCVNSERIHCFKTKVPTHYNALIIHPSFLQKYSIPHNAIFTPHISDKEAAKLYRVIMNENKNKLTFWRSAQKSAIVTLIIHLYRNYSNVEEKTQAVPYAKSNLVKKSIEYIRLHYLEDISTADIARELGVTVNHLCACFKDVTNITIKKYINNIRCYDAQVMLSSGKYSVIEVGTHCGFDNMAYFAKTYRSIIGVNPSVTLSEAKKQLNVNEGRLQRTNEKQTEN